MSKMVLLPTATISGTATVCKDAPSQEITFTGSGETAPYTFTYTINGGAIQTVSTTATSSSVTVSVPTTVVGVYTYELVNVSCGTPGCTQVQTGSAIVTVLTLPTATISGTALVCKNTPSQEITFTGSGATAPYTFTYTIDGGAEQTVSTTATSDTATVLVPTNTIGVFNYTLVSVSSTSLGCTQLQAGEAIVTVLALPTATITGTATVGKDNPFPVYVTLNGAGGSAPYTFIYTINGGPQQTVTTSTSSSVTVQVPTNVVGVFTYSLVSVSSPGAGCTNLQTGDATVTVKILPFAAINGPSALCINTPSQVVTFTGSGVNAPYTFVYTINGGPQLTVSTTISNSVTVPIPTDVAGTFTYTLVSVSCPSFECFNLQTGSITVTIAPRPTAAITGTTTICPNNSTSFTITGTPNALVIIKSSSNLYSTITLNAAGTAVFFTPLLQETTTYTILSATLDGCNNPITGSTAIANINSNGCATVLAGNIDLYNNIDPVCEIGDGRELTASYQDLGTSTSYAVSSIPYCPQAAFSGPGFTPVSVGIDDVWSGDIVLPFKFCFFGNEYSTANIGSNGALTFNSFTPNSFSPWSMSGQSALPSTSFPIKNAIFGVYQDTNPESSPANVSVNYQLMGNYPCRKLVINFANLAQFQCNQSVGLQTD